jgi:hypothetical protein
MNKKPALCFSGMILFGVLSANACSSGGGGTIDDDGGTGDGGSGDARGQGDAPQNSDGSAAGCPATIPRDGTPCSLPNGTVCNYGCDQGGPGNATCSGGKWAIALFDIACENQLPFACGSTQCNANQYCVNPCCGGEAPQCVPAPDSGVCPAGTTSGTCPGTETPGCISNGCTPPPPYCIDTPNPPGGCTLKAGTRAYQCVCA